jgi:beta-lactamase superfamily II metal-dependent hydrolase
MTYTVLPVGQGTGTLIQVINDAGEPITTILIDLGSRLWHQSVFGERSTDIVETALRNMKTSGPTLDAVFISHADGDHVNEIPKLLDRFKKLGETTDRQKILVVNNVWFGGKTGYYAKKKQTGNVLNKLKEYGATLETVSLDASDLKKPEYCKNGIEIFIMIGNTVHGNTSIVANTYSSVGNDQKYLTNTDSLVLLVRYGTATRRHIVATGDATGITMAACNQRLNLEFATANWLKPVESIALPHHGSSATTYNVLNADTKVTGTDDIAQQVVEEFVDFLEPESLTISAGQTKYKHPVYRAIDDFAKFVSDAKYSDPSLDNNEHFYTVYLEAGEFPLLVDLNYAKPPPTAAKWPPSARWWNVRTSQSIYSIDYYELNADNLSLSVPVIESSDLVTNSADAVFRDPDAPYDDPVPPWGCAWEYKISQDGKQVDFSQKHPIDYEIGEAEYEMAAALPERLALIPRVPAPVPVPVREPTVVSITAQSSAALPRRHRVRALL